MRRSPSGSPSPLPRPASPPRSVMEVAAESVEQAQDSPLPPNATHLAREANRLEATMWAARQVEAVSGAISGSREGEGRGMQRVWGEGEGSFDPDKASRERRRVGVFLRILAVCMFVDASCLNIVPTLMPSLAHALGLEQESIALLLGVRSFTAAALSLPVGFLLSHLGHRSVLTLAFVAATGGCALLAWRGSWQHLALALVIQGACTQTVRSGCASFAAALFSEAKGPYEGGFGGPLADSGQQFSDLDLQEGGGRDELAGPPHQALYGDHVVMEAMAETEGGKEQAGAGKGSLVSTLGVFYSWGSMGGVVGPIGGSILYQLVAPWLPFAILGGLSSLLATIVACFRLPEVKGPGGEEGEQEGASNYDRLREHALPELTYPYRGVSNFDVLRGEGAPDSKVEVQGDPLEAPGTRVKRKMNLRDTLVLVARDRAGVVVLYVAGMQSMAWGIVEVVVPFFLQERCELGTVEVGLAIGINNLAYGIMALFAGNLVQRLGSRTCVMLGLSLVIVTLPLICIIGLSCNLPLQLSLDFLMGVGFAMLETPLFALLVKFLEEHGSRLDYGLVMAIYQFAFSAGYAVGPFFAALLFLKFISVGVMGSMSILLLIGLVLWGLTIKT